MSPFRTPYTSLRTLLAASFGWILVLDPVPALAQLSNPVYVEDSPQAWELFQRAQDLGSDNSAETLRIWQELLDDYPLKLIPVSESASEQFTSVRQRVMDELRTDPALLERYQNIESAEAGRQLQSGQLLELATSRSLTVPGLDALLLLAQQGIEEARFHAALDWLDEASRHPFLTGEHAAHCWYMTGLAAHYAADAERLAMAERRLDELGASAAPMREELRALIRSGGGPVITEGLSALDSSASTDLSDLVAEEIWSVPLEDSLLSRRFSTPTGTSLIDHPGREQHRRAGDLTTGSGTVAGSTLYINEGYTVLGLDRFTGRSRWLHVARHRLTAPDPDSEQTLDMNLISVEGDRLVTLTGHAAASGRTSDSAVLCLNAETGELLWSQNLEGLGGIEDNEGLFPHGEPIIAEGSVFVLARKVTRQLLTSCYVVSLDLQTGELQWARHIASSGGLRRSARNLSTLVYDRGDIYVATPVGAIARVNANSGAIRWLRRYHVPISPRFADQNRRPWELPGPVLTKTAVIALQPDLRRVVVLDRETGHQLESYAAETYDGWNSPAYLLAGEHLIYAVGREIRAFRLDALGQPAWQLPELTQSTEEGISAETPTLELRGRVQLAQDVLIVPTLEGVLVVDDETGAIRQRIPVRSIGNPIATDAQLVIAGSDRIDAFMSFRRAEMMLRQRVVSNPGDPEPAISLLRLGARARQLALALEASELAIDAIDREPDFGTALDARRELFGLLLEIDAADVAVTEAEGEALHTIIGMVAIEPEQRVEHLLAYGRWLSNHSLAEAIEQYQAILADPRLAPVRRAENGLTRSASAWAIDRIGELITRHGPAIYEPQADFARMALAQIRPEEPDAIPRLLSIANELPFAPAASDASMEASNLLFRGDNRQAALASLLHSYRAANSAAIRNRLLGQYVWLCSEANWLDAARSALDRPSANADGERLETPDGRRSVREWRRELDAMLDVQPPPRIGARPGQGEVLPGRLVPVHPDGRLGRSPEGFLIFDGIEIAMRSADGLQELWRTTLDDPAPQLLHLDQEQAILWFGTDQDDPRAIGLDARTGAERWSTPRLGRYLGEPVSDLIRERGVREQMPGGEPFNPKETLPLLSRDRLIIVQRSGGVLSFDLRDPAEPQWGQLALLEQVHLAEVHDFGIVLAGLQRQPDSPVSPAVLAPRILILDPEDGTVRHEIRPIGRSGVRWMSVGPLATLVYGTAEGMEAVDLLTGTKRWTNQAYETMETQSGWPVDDLVLIEDREGSLRAVDLERGSVSDRFVPPLQGDWDPLELQDVLIADGRLYARYRERVVQYDGQGRALGADVTTDSRDYDWVLPVEDGLLVLSRFQTEQAIIPDRSGRVTQHSYRIYRLAPDCKLRDESYVLPPITQRLVQVETIDGWILLSTPTETLAIPLPEEG